MGKYSGRGLVALLFLSASAPVHAEDVSISIDHAKSATYQPEITPQLGDRIGVSVSNTCPARFEYQAVPLTDEAAQPSPLDDQSGNKCTLEQAKSKLKEQGFCELATQKFSFVHGKAARAYKIAITRKSGVTGEVNGLSTADFNGAATKMTGDTACAVPSDLAKKATRLDNAEYYVNVKSSPWALGMSGGLTISDVVDPRFAIVNDPASTTTPAGKIVVRDRDAEDSQKLGFAGFVHVHHEKWKLADIPIAGTFGLGIQKDNTISGFLGVSATAFDLAYLTLGWNWSSIDRLPAGQQVGQPPINDNVLNNLPKKTDNGWFLAVSFKFMGPRESFFKGVITPKPAEAPKTEEKK